VRSSRRNFLLSTSAALLRAQTAPLVVIAADGHGLHLSALGTPALRTPRLDELADEGALYGNAHAASALPDLRPTATFPASAPRETYAQALELFRKKPAVTVITLDRAAAFANARPSPDTALLRVPPHWPDLPAARAEWQRYLMFVQAMDALTGSVLDALAKAGWAEEALVVYASLRGPATHRPLHGEALRVPLLLRGPGVPAASRNAALVSLADLPTPTARPHVHYTSDSGASVFDGRFRYIRNNARPRAIPRGWETMQPDFPAHSRWWNAPVPPEELYDLAADPHELHNVAPDAAYRDHASRLAKLAIR
jgi:arylsulfatase A-like enzyme